jgi:glycosyltransferase involved in cell wall biosynthesis
MKIAFCAPFPPELFRSIVRLRDDGQRSHPCSWIRALSQKLSELQDIELHIITISANVMGDSSFSADGVHYHFIDSSLPLWLTKALGLDPTSSLWIRPLARICKRLREISPDIVHGHGTEGCFSLAAVYSRFPHVISIQGVMADVFGEEGSRRARIVRHFEAHTVRKARYINVKNYVTRDFVEKLKVKAQVFFIEPSINEIFWSRDAPQYGKKLFFSGSLIKRKGIEEFIHVVSRLQATVPGLKAYVLGEGSADYVARLKGLAESLGVIEKVLFTGQIDFARIVDLYSLGGIFCMTSHVEASPNVVLEAMAAGLPVVSTNVGALPKIVEDGKSGIVVNRSCIDEMVSAISGILNNESLYYNFGRRGREIATSRWKPSIIAQKHLEMYKHIIDKENFPAGQK